MSIQLKEAEKPEDMTYKYRIGYWWSEKKSQKLNATELAALFAEKDCELVKLDLERPLEEQGPFSLIVHKISDILVKADQGDASAKKSVNAFESYVRKNPQTVILDPLDNNRTLLDRYKQYRLIEQSSLAKEGVVFTPPFVHLTSTNIDVNRGRIRRSNITFPIVCKPILAQGTTGAHEMCIIFNETGLKDVKPPCVAQSFVNHNAKLFKLFVIKDKYYIMERPSLKNFHAGQYETVFFFSHDISKPNSSSSLTELDEEDKFNLEQLLSARLSLKSEELLGKSNTLSCYPHSHQLIGHNVTRIANTKDEHENGTRQHYQPHQNGCSFKKQHEKIHSSKRTLIKQQRDIQTIHDGDSNCTSSHYSPTLPTDERLDTIVKVFSEKLGLTFYGVDIIIENQTSRYAIIDMNTFPGYDGVDNFLAIFRDVVCDAIPQDITDQQCQSPQQKLGSLKKPTEIDSGIEST